MSESTDGMRALRVIVEALVAEGVQAEFFKWGRSLYPDEAAEIAERIWHDIDRALHGFEVTLPAKRRAA